MCTVSFIPIGDRVIITSNRDEKRWRLPARLPKEYPSLSGGMLFPRDGDSGGSWVTLCRNGNAGVLLNGAFTRHERKEPYLKSRGIVFLEVMGGNSPLRQFSGMSLKGIEPFTLILWEQNKLYECRWDETEQKHCLHLAAHRPHIWSSATLYSEEIRRKREKWFTEWLHDLPVPNQRAILQFHQFAGEGDKENDLFMSRHGIVSTVSITSMEVSPRKAIFHYTDVIADETVEHQIDIQNRHLYN